MSDSFDKMISDLGTGVNDAYRGGIDPCNITRALLWLAYQINLNLAGNMKDADEHMRFHMDEISDAFVEHSISPQSAEELMIKRKLH